MWYHYSLRQKEARENLYKNNHKKGSITKDFKKSDTSIPAPPEATIDLLEPEINSVWFEYPYNQINYIDNTNYDTHLIDAHEEHIR